MNREEIQEKALQILLPHTRAGIGLSMGVGKTLVGLKHANHYYTDYLKILVVAPKKSIFQSWLDEAEKHSLQHLIPHIDFTTYLSLDKHAHDYDIIYLDECHSLLYSHDEWLGKFQGFIVGLTGTPPRFAGSEKGQMVEKYCPILYKYIADEAISDGILNDYRITIHMLSLNTMKDIRVEKNGKLWWTSEKASYDYWTSRLDNARSAKEEQIMRVMRMKALMGFKSKEKYAKNLFGTIQEKVILFANTQEQAELLCSKSYHSNNPDSEENLEKFKTGTIMKLSCVLQLNEGVNIPELRAGIIMHAYGNERKSSQRIGRLLRLNPDETAVIHILCYEDTVDEKWVSEALKNFDPDKITTKQREIIGTNR
jgi:superfamily II DNA or RNA helicase